MRRARERRGKVRVVPATSRTGTRFAFSPQQDELRDSLRRFLEDTSSTREVRRVMEEVSGWERPYWRQLASEIGVCGVHVPQDWGGLGLGFVELAIVCEEMGRALTCAPYLASVGMATSAILNAGSEAQKKALLPGIVAGECVGTLAVAEENSAWQVEGMDLVARQSDAGLRLDGIKTYVLDGHTADLIIVAGRAPGIDGPEGIRLAIVRGDAPGLERRALPTMDPTRKLARLRFADVPAEALGEHGVAASALARTLDQALILLANEMVGGAQRVLETTVEYAKLRVQFGRSIGSFQAIKHKLADILLEVELAKSAAYHAAAIVDGGRPDEISPVAALAKACASEAYLRAASDSIQIHGGIGFTWEHDAHLYFKRAKSGQVLLGSPDVHRETLVRHWGDPPRKEAAS